MTIPILTPFRVVLVFALVLAPSVAAAEWGAALWGEMIWGAPVDVPALPGGGLVLAAFLAGSASWALLRRHQRAAVVLGALAFATPLLSQAEVITFPNLFANGTVADANEVNENFQAASFAFDKFTNQFGRDPADPQGNLPNTQGVCANRAIGEVWQFAGNYEPQGTVFAHGQNLSIVQYTSLFSIVGIRYGGDGLTKFGVPDLRGLEPSGINYVICTLGAFPYQN